MNPFNLESLISKPTFVQSINPTCIDLIKSKITQSVLEVGISHHHGFITTAPRSTGNAIRKICQDYKTLNIKSFSKNLEKCLKNHTTNDYSYFQNVSLKPLNKHAPIKKKILSFQSPLCQKL